MGRIPRGQLLFDGCYAHIFSRSIEKKFIFKTDADFEYFKRLLITAKTRYDFQIYHYCLMHTHFHFALRIGNGEAFSQGMKAVKYDYTQDYNRRHQRRGPLWQNRFKSLLIENEQYLYACGLYIENNPVETGVVGEKTKWPYSSACYYEQKANDPLVDPYELPELGAEQKQLLPESFVKGSGIGSAFFRFQLKEGHKPLSVP